MLINRSTLGRVGIWAREMRFDPDPSAIADAAAELEEHGWSALWIPDAGGDIFGAVDVLLDATRSVAIATGILNIWMQDPEEVARESNARWESGRFVLGLGASHAALVEQYARPYSAMREYLDALDAATPPVPDGARLLAALGPKMVALSGDRAAGAHPYLVTVEHTRSAREILGPDAVLAPELGVVLDGDVARGRERARAHIADYLELPNYANSMRRMGFTEDDLRDGGSDRLVDAVVAVGDEEAIRARVEEHLDAGADHVCIQVVGPMGQPLPRETWRQLAPVLLG
jgi:probable F420-dependent oxidoreductase